ncbi:MAG: DUF2254 domain-containing protein [Acidimicrobiia bacterium]|nr:DUF2254 domain-containing protein [Acidimicrobiia bacterium]
MSDFVRSRPAPTNSLRSLRFKEHALDSLWFMPLCGAILAWLISRITLYLDHLTQTASKFPDLIPASAVTNSADAVTATTVAAAMLTLIAVVFSTMLVAVQLASSQYSPRITRVFVRARLTQITLAVFMTTFVFALNALIGCRASEDRLGPALTMRVLYLLVLTTMLTFLAFIHGMVRLLQVQYLLQKAAWACHHAIDRSFPAAAVYREVPAVSPSPAPLKVMGPLTRHPRLTMRRSNGPRPRVLQAVDLAGLAAAAAELNCWVELQMPVGDHAGPSRVVALIHGENPDALAGTWVHRFMLFGTERTLLQDPGFGIRLLVDAASRALSPAINDPTTAVQALLRIEDLLARMTYHPDPSGWYTDEAGTLRVKMLEPGFIRLATMGLTEILHYGATAPQVIRALLSMSANLASITEGERHSFFEDYQQRCEVTAYANMSHRTRDIAIEADHMGFG